MAGRTAKKIEKDQLTALLEKLNTLALQILDEIEEARRNKKTVDFEELKAPLLAIKEIKDLVKINDKVKHSKTSDLLEIDLEDLANVNKLEEELYEEGQEL